MSTPTFIIQPSDEKVAVALQAWQWLPIENKQVAVITSFGDLFLQDEEGIWFLDTLGGRLDKVCASLDELQGILNTRDGQDQYLLAGLVVEATQRGLLLGPDQCYDFAINPVLGGELAIENVEIQDFAVAVDIAGQIHEQCKDLPPGTPISEIKFEEPDS